MAVIELKNIDNISQSCDHVKAASVDYHWKTKCQTSFWKKFKYIITHITVEPIVFLYILASTMNSLVTQNLSLEKACRVNLHLNESICDAMVLRNRSGYLPEDEVDVQKMVVQWAAYKAFVIGSVTVVLIVFFGSWSDRHRRRKPLILFPMYGDLIGSIGLLICSFYLRELSIEYTWLVDTISLALFGGPCILFLGIYSYVGGNSSEEDKTLRIGSVAIANMVGMSTGMFMSGILLNRLGFLGAYSISATCLTMAILYGRVMVKEKGVKVEEDVKTGFFQDLFALEHVKNTFKICFQKRECNRRKRILILMFLSMMVMGSMYGELTVQYMYLRLKCGWNEVDFSIYNALHFGIQIFGNSFALSFFSKYLKWDDAILGIIAIISKSSAYLIYAFAPTGMYFYIGAVVEIFYAAIFIAMRSIMAKVVPPHELGQSNSIFGICEALMPFIFGPLYSKIYIVTMTVFPGTFLLFSLGLYMVAFCLFMCLYKSGRDQSKLQVKEKPWNMK
ncbi:hypothetical protein HHI36_003463 [Cryptolaemus montrouzieri]|uniref:Solute carrier family 46 member 3 n=1 Tax=Cryptolaemus montrouzieri TaxID=559131 RepID=A0ABD2PDM1_9CUCU